MARVSHIRPLQSRDTCPDLWSARLGHGRADPLDAPGVTRSCSRWGRRVPANYVPRSSQVVWSATPRSTSIHLPTSLAIDPGMSNMSKGL